MRFPGARRERHIDDAPMKLGWHVVARLAVSEARVLPRHREAPVEHLRQVHEIVAVLDKVRFSLRIVP